MGVFTGSMLIFGGVKPKQPGAPLPRYEIGLVCTPDLPCFLCSSHKTFFSSTGRYKDAQMLPGHRWFMQNGTLTSWATYYKSLTWIKVPCSLFLEEHTPSRIEECSEECTHVSEDHLVGQFWGDSLTKPPFEGDPGWGQFGRLGKHMGNTAFEK